MTASEPLRPDPSTPDRAAPPDPTALGDPPPLGRHGRGDPPRRSWRRWLPLLLLALCAALFFAFDLDRFASLDHLREHHQHLAEFVAAHYTLALLIFAGIYVSFVALSLPGAVWLTVIGGFLFGALPAALIAVPSATIGASLLFLAAKSSLGEFLHSHAGPWLAKVERGFAENQWSYLLMMRLVPVMPFFIANLLPAFLGVALPVFIATTAIGIIPGTVVYSFVGAGLGSVLDDTAPLTLHSLLTPEIKLALTGLALLAALPVAVKHWRRRRQRLSNGTK